MTTLQFGYLVLGGAAGAVSRFWVGTWLERSLGAHYPWGTTVVNLAGTFALGFLWACWEAKGGVPSAVRALLLTGFLGAFTTFSTLMFEVAALLSSGRSTAALLHLFVHNALGLLCVFSGIALARAL